ncbi:Bet1-like protein [Drosera capensis]
MSMRGGAAPYRSSDGLSTRQVGGTDELQLRIDPMQGDLDDEITGLRKQVRQLRHVAQEIETEAKFQNDFMNQLVYIPLSSECFDNSGNNFCTNECYESSSWCEEQHEKIEEKRSPEGIKSYPPRRAVCTIVSLPGRPLVENLAPVKPPPAIGMRTIMSYRGTHMWAVPCHRKAFAYKVSSGKNG